MNNEVMLNEVVNALEAIVDCYGVNYKDPLVGLKHLGILIMDARELLIRMKIGHS